MRTLFGKFIAFAIFFALAPAQAAWFSLTFDGLTTGGSTSTVGVL